MISLPANSFLQPYSRYFIISLLSLAIVSPVFAFNRLDAVQALNSVRSDWTETDAEIWINNLRGESDPGLFVGDLVELSAASRLPGYFLVALIDPRGETTIIMTESEGVPVGQLVFPGDAEKFEQGEPVGEQSLFVFASDAPFSAIQLGLAGAISTLGKDQASLNELATALNNHSGKIAVSPRYTYYVDSPDNEISTRGIRKVMNAQMDVIKRQPRDEPVLVPVPDPVPEPVSVSDPVAASSALALDIKFKYNSFELEPEGMSQLDALGSALISLLEENQLPRISLEGHTDSSGPAEYNLELSGKRAKAARDYLGSNYGLSVSNIEARGMGESSPLFDNSSATSRAKNRRVELRVVQ